MLQSLVISRDEHEYFGNTTRHCERLRALEQLCLRALNSLIWHWF